MEEILRKGKNTNGIYDIPSGCPQDKVSQQLKLLESKSPNLSLRSPKIVKLDLTVDSSTKLTQKTLNFPSTSKPPSSPSPSISRPISSSVTNIPPAVKSQSNIERKQQEKEKLQQIKSSTDINIEKEKIEKNVVIEENPNQIEKNVRSEEDLEKMMRKYLPVVLPKGQMAEKLRNSAPYNFFLTTVSSATETHSDPLSLTFQELLDSSLGELESSVQINFMIDIGWLLAQYTFARCNKLPLIILYGDEEVNLRDINKKRPNVTSIKVNLPGPIGVHHTKMMLFFYKDNSMRVVVSTANLYEDDWHNRVQGLWISDKLPSIPEGQSHVTHGESETGFREDLMRYLIAYNIGKLQPIIARIRRTDFSSVKVFFVFSVPGSHRDSGKGIYYGHSRIASLLSSHSAPIDDVNPIHLQCSSIGSLGPNSSAWLSSEIATSFRRDSAPIGLRRMPQIKLIYPSLNNVLSSHDGIAGGGCLPYDGKTHEKQTWLKEHLHQWKASSRKRNQAMPHIKTYFRYSERGLYWFILTSANLSRSAWGAFNKGNKSLNPTLRINSYEAGVMFLPRVMIKKDRFPLTQSQQKDDVPIFPLPYDIPTLVYGPHDVPYCAEYLKAHIEKYGAKFD